MFKYKKFPLLGQVGYLESEVVLRGEKDDYIIKRIEESSNFYEETILSMFGLALMEKKGYVIDVGANIGNHTIFASKVLNRKTISIEPSRENLSFLKKNIKANNVAKKVCVKDVAVSGKRGCYSTKKFGGNTGKTQLVEDDNGRVKSVTIDKIVSRRRHSKEDVAGIKIDIEGMEREAIQGARNTIRNYESVIIVEDKKSLVPDILGEFPECGYRVRKPLPQSPTFLLYSNNYLSLCKPLLSVWKRVSKFI